MIVTPDNVTIVASGLDHPECVCIGPDLALYAGGEAGQVYRIDSNGILSQISSTGGFILGVAVDGDQNVYACDLARHEILSISQKGLISVRSRGLPGEAIMTPNSGVFDKEGRYYFSDSGDYWNKVGNGKIFVIDRLGRTTIFHRGPFHFANGIALHPTDKWLYVVETTARRVVRILLADPSAPPELVCELPEKVIPDGLAFVASGEFLISCYRPDAIYLVDAKGTVDLWAEDPTGELLNQPTNIALQNGRILIANLGGSQIVAIDSPFAPHPPSYPRVLQDH